MEKQQRMATDFNNFLNTASLVTLFVAPALILLPPRKLDFYTFSLAGAWVSCASYRNTFSDYMPFQQRRRLRVEAQEQRRLLEERELVVPQDKRKGSLLEEKAKEIWMGGEKDGWKERRLAEEQEKIDQGEGYASMIMDQIWDVWNQGKTGDEAQEKEAGKEKKG